eukprot:907583_1
MDQAQPAVFYGSSDDEDYVSFDEQELQKGIGDLYDEDSASDYNDDDDADDIVDLNNVQLEEEEEDAEMEMIIPQQQQQQQQQQKEEKKKSKTFSLFSRKKEKESESMMRPSSFASNNNNNRKNKKKSKSSQLSKRMNRLRQNQQIMQSHIKAPRQKKVVHKQRVNTNVISIDLGTLKTAASNVATGDAFECKGCKSILSKHDELLKQYSEIKLDDEDDSIWICKFCNHINVISVDDEEIPKDETVDYILAPPSSMNEESKSNDKTESQIIFCIDISGSMCVSQQIDAKHSKFKLKGDHLGQDQDDLSQFID